ncbi:DUF2690 domain-containing protein [Streptomyces sp. NPDC057460]|uniref:DUF2690 domain-containing protein n=1 Tax=Streptomyces sp. NPDC057460 TaxID=3346141 RepID=UPI0036999DB8
MLDKTTRPRKIGGRSRTSRPRTLPPILGVQTGGRQAADGVGDQASQRLRGARLTARGRKYGATVELRCSPHCWAAWAKMRRTSPGDRILITPQKGNTEEYRPRTGHDAHTPMVPVPPRRPSLRTYPRPRSRLWHRPVTATAAASPS